MNEFREKHSPVDHRDFKKDDLLEFIKERSQELGPEMEKWYADFHENPELGGEEYRTSQKVKEYLESIGVEIVGDKIGRGTKLKVGEEEKISIGTGLVAMIRGKEGGPTVALRADMDALPVSENEKNLPCSKEKDKMHACGHDAHVAGLMGAARILKELADRGELEGNAVLIFQPSEEKAHQKESGAIQIVKFLDKKGLRNEIGAFLGLHVYSDLERGSVMLKEGVQTTSSGEVDIRLKGPGGHVINIYESPDLNNVFSRINVRLKEVFRPFYERQEALVGATREKFVGSGYNVLPAEGESTWVIRVASPLYKEISEGILDQIKLVVQEEVKKEMEKVDSSKGEVKVEIERRHGYRPVISRDPKLAMILEKSGQEVIEKFKVNKELIMGGEDFSFYLEEFKGREIPGVFMMVGAANSEKGIPKVSHHSPDFKIDQGVIKDLAAVHSAFTIKTFDYLKQKKEA